MKKSMLCGLLTVSGHYQDAESGKDVACYWINGTRTDLPKGTNENAYATGIALKVE